MFKTATIPINFYLMMQKSAVALICYEMEGVTPLVIMQSMGPTPSWIVSQE